jgi:hypothetical protein
MGSVYYPSSIKSIYNHTLNLIQRHLHCYPAVPQEKMLHYERLKAYDSRSGTSKQCWEESALKLGLVDTLNQIHFLVLCPPPIPTSTLQQELTGSNQTRLNLNEFSSSKSNAIKNGDTDDSKTKYETPNDLGSNGRNLDLNNVATLSKG